MILKILSGFTLLVKVKKNEGEKIFVRKESINISDEI